MPLYTFSLDGFHINNTRAPDSDTDTVAIFLQVGDRSFGTLTMDMGDVGTGDHSVGLEFPFIRIDDPATQVIFNYQIVNAGNFHGNLHSNLSASAETLAGTLAGAGAGLGGAAGVWLLVAAGGVEILNFLFNALDPNCDGPVAVDQIIAPASDFDQMVPGGNGTFTQTRPYPGQNSPDFCGANSSYTATYSVTIIPTDTPLIAFSPPDIEFGLVAVGDERSATLTISNEGQVDLIVSIPGSPPGPFRWDDVANMTISPGQEEEVSVDFIPRGDGVAAATMLVQSNAATSPHAVKISGRGSGHIEPQ